ncbi:extracellular solute-binding protein [Sphingomonas ginkgonis]|uniref:Extracellular solute-binding protein n=1 Tax=Sphingomonas ginkgonis TaxID=2315330 RepID=A0A3R9WTI3_9SPHN|nr:extracellular solute-binding protein [Sphingomonas ginkgonis]RST31449.1 extracellular solute-binding protein [Sphingomonas ginkgonis]
MTACDPSLSRRTLLSGAAATLAAGCSAVGSPNRLSLWAMSYQGDYSPMLMPAFTRATGIDVDVQSVPWTEAHQKLLTAHAGNALPDVLMLSNGWIGEFAMIGAIAPVPSPALLADLVPGLLDGTRVGGTAFAVPWSAAPPVQFYRRDLLADAGYPAAPESWGEWRRMGAALKRRRPDDFAFLMLLNWPQTLITMMIQTGAPMLRDRNTRGHFQTPEAREALAYYVSLFTDGYAPKVLSTEVQDPLAALAQGQFAVWPTGPTLLLDLHRRRAELPAERWGTARLAGPDGPTRATAEDVSLCVSAASPRQADAWRLVAHLTSPASELRFASLIGNLPARRSAWASLETSAPILAPFAAQVREIATTPRVVEWEQIQTEVQLIAERVVRGQLSVDQGLAEADRHVDRILAKRRALVEAGRLA